MSRSASNAGRPASYGQRDGDVGAAGERLDEPPLRGGQVLEAVGEDGLALPGGEVRLEPLRGRARSRSRSQRPSRVELRAVGARRAARGRRRARPARAGPTRARRPPAAARRRSRRSAPSGRARSARPWSSARRTSSARCASVATGRRAGVAAHDPLEEVVEGADRAAEQAARPREQLALDAVDVRPVRHDQHRIVVRGAPDSAPGGARPCPRWRAPRSARAAPTHGSPGRGRLLDAPRRIAGKWGKARGGGRCRRRGRRVRRRTSAGGRGVRPAARHLAGAVVAEIGLLGAATRVGIGQTQRRALRVADLLAAVVANEHGLSSHEFLLSSGRVRRILTENQAAFRDERIRHDRSSESNARSSGVELDIRAPTTRKCRGRKSSIVLPSRYWSTPRG